jgi:hypothetical protein
MAIRHFDEWVRTEPSGRRVHELHAWIGDDPPAPAPRPRRRTGDASANAPGELKAGTVPGGNPPVYRSPSDPDGDVPSTGGLPEVSKRQSTEPESAGEFDQTPAPTARFDQSTTPEFIDARSLRVTAKDQHGQTRRFGMTVWGPQEQPDDNYLTQVGDRALTDLVWGAAQNEIVGLARLQQKLNDFYRRR